MTLKGHQDEVTSVAISANGVLASGSKDKTIKLWELTTGKLISTITNQEQIRAVTYTPNGQILAIGCNDGNIKLLSQTQLQLKDLL